MRTHLLPRLALAIALPLAATTMMPSMARAADQTAEQLYQEGKAAAGKKDWVLACSKFAESNAREPAPGTLLNLGDCEENRGQFTQAIAHFEAAARLCKPGDERAEYARQRSFTLERRAPKLTVKLQASTPAGTVIEKDGVALGAAQIGVPIVIDPGEHTLVVRAPGRTESRGSVRIALGESREIEVTAGMPIPQGAVTQTTPTTAAPAVATTAEIPKDTNGSEPTKTAAYVSFGVGAVGLAIGVVGGLLTMSAKSTADSHCPAQGCDSEGLSAEDRGKTWSTISTAGFVVAGLGAATGAGLLLFGPKSKTTTTTGGLTVQPTAAGAQLRWIGSF